MHVYLQMRGKEMHVNEQHAPSSLPFTYDQHGICPPYSMSLLIEMYRSQQCACKLFPLLSPAVLEGEGGSEEAWRPQWCSN